MLVRPATLEDVDWLVYLGRRAHIESPRYHAIPFDPERTKEFATAVLNNEWTLTLVLEADEGVVCGALLGIVAPHIFSQQLFASDIFFYIEPEHRGGLGALKLLREWERVLRSDGRAIESVLGISSEIDNERTRKFYERLGYRAAGYMMVKQHERS